MKKVTSIILFGFLMSGICKAQSVDFNFLFRPGITLGSEITPAAAVNDTSSFGINKYRFQATIPLKTRFGVDLKKLDAKAKQTFLHFNGSMRQPQFSKLGITGAPIYTFSAGLTGVTAGIQNGIWLYSLNFYYSESAETMSFFRPNALAYAAKIRFKSLKFVYFYGAAGIYNFGRGFATPIAGFTAKLNRNTRLTVALPVQIKCTYSLTKKTTLALASTYSGFNVAHRDSGNVVLNYHHVKHHFDVDIKLDRQLQIGLEGGLSTFRFIRVMGETEIMPFRARLAPYISATVHYTFGRSLFNLRMEGID